MFIKVASEGGPSLEDAGNFKAFKVVSEIPLEAAAPLLAGVGRVDGTHIWVDPAWLKANGPDDAGWQTGLAKMLDYAKTAGWVDDAGAVRAHIES
jgi:hypothetical protein